MRTRRNVVLGFVLLILLVVGVDHVTGDAHYGTSVECKFHFWFYNFGDSTYYDSTDSRRFVAYPCSTCYADTAAAGEWLGYIHSEPSWYLRKDESDCVTIVMYDTLNTVVMIESLSVAVPDSVRWFHKLYADSVDADIVLADSIKAIAYLSTQIIVADSSDAGMMVPDSVKASAYISTPKLLVDSIAAKDSSEVLFTDYVAMSRLMVDSIAPQDSTEIRFTDDVAVTGNIDASITITGLDIHATHDVTVADDLTVDGQSWLKYEVGINQAPDGNRHLNIVDNTITTTVSKVGVYLAMTKTAGVTDHEDNLTGYYGLITNSDADQAIGDITGVYSEAKNHTGDCQNLYGVKGYAYAYGDTVNGNAYGVYGQSQVRVTTGHVDGSTYAGYFAPNKAGSVDGKVYGVAIANGTGVDSAFVSLEGAASRFAGAVEIQGTTTTPRVDTDKIAPADSTYTHAEMPFEWDTNFEVVYDIDNLDAGTGCDTLYIPGAEPGDTFDPYWKCERLIGGGYHDYGLSKYTPLSPNVICFVADSVRICCTHLRNGGCDTLVIRDIGPAATAD